ncbi:uncharacterized protein LOC134748437 [Cydia strobilella]|uniref:uncharacterized protein LOC134748437 n=1 Tax=Cydia strobilella TaxID=1100964 RepID=UPI0030057880
MCDNQNVKADRIRCEACRTINLATDKYNPKPSMELYNKCTPVRKPDCGGRFTELPLNPTCIRVCPRHEVLARMKGELPPKMCPVPYGHGKLMYAVKAGLLVGAVYFTYTQGVWGDQRDVTEAIARWQEYIRSMNTRRPPVFDKCGLVIKKENPESIIAPAYALYKHFVTLCFAGIVKLPQILKCQYLEYLKAIHKKKLDEIRERKLRKQG